jgi:hypothetical protein
MLLPDVEVVTVVTVFKKYMVALVKENEDE